MAGARRSLWIALLALAAGLGVAAADAPRAPEPEVLGEGAWLIRGGILPNRQPDGNSVVLQTPGGLLVVDTGRHAWHREAILRLARERRRPIAAIVNTHWHLDHVSGNPTLKQAHPGARVHASNAIDGALTGFLASSAADARRRLDAGGLPAELAEDVRGDLATFANGAALKPDVVVARSARRTLAGRAVHLHLARHAATAGDVWLYDPATRLAVAGDLVTLPAPFLDTACPHGWRNALSAIWATPFERVIPGHGPPMSRSQFADWRWAFGRFIDCAAARREGCAAGWVEDAGALIPEGERPRARAMADYYVGMLRANGGRSPSCGA